MSRRTALVTGSTDGIGVAIARTLAIGGAQVIVSGRNAERGEQVVESSHEAPQRLDVVRFCGLSVVPTWGLFARSAGRTALFAGQGRVPSAALRKLIASVIAAWAACVSRRALSMTKSWIMPW